MHSREMAKRFFAILCLTIICLFSFAQTEVKLQMRDSGSHTLTVSDAGKIYFDNGYMLVDEGNGIPYSFLLSDIKKVMFDHITSVETLETPNIRIYPNPATNYLKISSEQNTAIPYQIFALDGRLVLSGSAHSEEPIAISSLAKGLYLLKIDGKTFKISKL